jgi:hypothetical protein
MTTTNVNIALVRGGQISGTVHDTDGNPLRLINVQVLDIQGKAVLTTSTDALGDYLTKPGLPAGDYKLLFFNNTSLCQPEVLSATTYYSGALTRQSATPLAVIAGSITPNVNVTMHRAMLQPRRYLPMMRR